MVVGANSDRQNIFPNALAHHEYVIHCKIPITQLKESLNSMRVHRWLCGIIYCGIIYSMVLISQSCDYCPGTRTYFPWLALRVEYRL